MKTLTTIACFALTSPTLTLAASNTMVIITHEKIASLKPADEITREAFAEKWGQFEVRIPKAQFPIAAPNCRKEIILRSKGVDPSASDRDKQLARRWSIYQSLRDIIRDKTGSVEVPIALGPYMQKDKAGEPVLEYCNAYINAKAFDAHG
jgi:hypothetical protein